MNDRDRIGPALGKIPSGLFIATAMVDGAPTGMLCSFVEQAGFEPPMVSLAIAPGRPITPALDGHGVFGLHIVSKDDGALLKSFAKPAGAEVFARHALTENVFGIPQLAEAWAFLACKVRGKLAAGDHTVYVAEVIDGALREGGEPMVRVRANGFGY